MNTSRTRYSTSIELNQTSSAIGSATSSEIEPTKVAAEEQLIVDDRADRRPAQMVEEKLSGMLKGDFSIVSQLRTKNLIGRRS